MKDLFVGVDGARKPSGGAIGMRFLDRLVATTRGRAFMLSFLASTEEADEGHVFDELRRRVDDPELHKMVSRHAADEERHASILKERVAALGHPVSVMPESLRVVTRLDRLLGGFADRFLQRDLGIMETYVLLLVLEERAVLEWPTIVKALAKVDPASASVVAGIIEDEKRHVKYARAIAARYAPSREVLAATLARVRAAEQRAYDEHTQVFTDYVVSRGLLDVGTLEWFFWKGIATAGSLRRKGAQSASPSTLQMTTR